MHRLDRPAAGHEAVGEVIEQLRVRRRPPLLAEVIGSTHQSLSEMVLPDAVDHHACRQRVLRTAQPLGQLQATAALAVGDRLAAEDLQEAARRLGAGRLGVAALLDGDVVRRPLADGVDRLAVRQLREIARRLMFLGAGKGYFVLSNIP